MLSAARLGAVAIFLLSAIPGVAEAVDAPLAAQPLVAQPAAAQPAPPSTSTSAEGGEHALAALSAPSTLRRRPGAPYALLTLDRHHVKWGAPQPGQGAVVRYALVTGPVDRPDGVNCTAIGPLDGALPRSGLSGAQFAAEIRAAMAAWEAAADIRFLPVTDAATADLLIGVQRRPVGIAFADVILKERGTGNLATIGQAAICFNPELAWEDGFDGDDATPDVRYVAAHELGHILGLDHAWGADKLMNFKYRETLRLPQQNDLAGAAFLYGPSRSPAPVAEAVPDATPVVQQLHGSAADAP